MKVIDVLNMIAHKTLMEGIRFKYEKDIYKYEGGSFLCRESDGKAISDIYAIECILNDEMEEIPFSKPIEELSVPEITPFNQFTVDTILKINELIRAVNRLKTEKETE